MTAAVSAIAAAGSQPVPSSSQKTKVVVLGTGWAAHALLKEIDATKFEVTTVSPRNFFLFTPMLAASAVGTVEYRSITEPIRKVNAEANYLEATCTGIDVARKSITCENVVCEGTTCNIEVSLGCSKATVAGQRAGGGRGGGIPSCGTYLCGRERRGGEKRRPDDIGVLPKYGNIVEIETPFMAGGIIGAGRGATHTEETK